MFRSRSLQLSTLTVARTMVVCSLAVLVALFTTVILGCGGTPMTVVTVTASPSVDPIVGTWREVNSDMKELGLPVDDEIVVDPAYAGRYAVSYDLGETGDGKSNGGFTMNVVLQEDGKYVDSSDDSIWLEMSPSGVLEAKYLNDLGEEEVTQFERYGQ